jgi:DNA-binding winged helix-turn-helix (wHTH) protein
MTSSDSRTPKAPDAALPSQDEASHTSFDTTSEGSSLDHEALRRTKGIDPMSLATLDVTSNRRTTGSIPGGNPDNALPRLRAVPSGTEARGFVLYVGLDESKAAAAGTDLGAIVEQLKKLAAQLAPSVETYAAVALAPRGSGGRDVDVVRLALQDPAALAKHRQVEEPAAKIHGGVIVDVSRKRVVLDGETAALTYKEFELLQYLVQREGRTIERTELISSLWADGDDEDIPNERTIDVHVRRLRSKLGAYEDIVRTVRGVGYRFDRHADVSVRQASTPSPDFF